MSERLSKSELDEQMNKIVGTAKKMQDYMFKHLCEADGEIKLATALGTLAMLNAMTAIVVSQTSERHTAFEVAMDIAQGTRSAIADVTGGKIPCDVAPTSTAH